MTTDVHGLLLIESPHGRLYRFALFPRDGVLTLQTLDGAYFWDVDLDADDGEPFWPLAELILGRGPRVPGDVAGYVVTDPPRRTVTAFTIDHTGATAHRAPVVSSRRRGLVPGEMRPVHSLAALLGGPTPPPLRRVDRHTRRAA